MKDPVSQGLNSLACGLRPYVANRVRTVLHDADLVLKINDWDAQALMVFMWERWNELFRSELTFVERSLISELREFRNRWAHQDALNERDVYRVLDNIERLLLAVGSHQVQTVSRLRRESLTRLWTTELWESEKHRRIRLLWPYLLYGSSALALSFVLVSFGRTPWSWILSILILLGFLRLASTQSARELNRGPGPHECTDCGRIIYSFECPYCSLPFPELRNPHNPALLVSGVCLKELTSSSS